MASSDRHRGVRFEHNESFGNRGIPELGASYLLWNGRGPLGAFRLRGRYAGGIKEPRFEETFGVGGFGIIGNPNSEAGDESQS